MKQRTPWSATPVAVSVLGLMPDDGHGKDFAALLDADEVGAMKSPVVTPGPLRTWLCRPRPWT
jgi:hypothetical protein